MIISLIVFLIILKINYNWMDDRKERIFRIIALMEFCLYFVLLGVSSQ